MNNNKSVFAKWKKYLNEGQLSSYEINGKIPLYHYSQANVEELELDPEYFLSHRNTFSKREFESSQVPRTFFYVDLDQAERIVKSNRSLYGVEVPADEVYNLHLDPDKIKEQSVPRGAFFVDYNNVLETIRENYNGVFYKLPNMDVVAWFQPITVQKLTEEI